MAVCVRRRILLLVGCMWLVACAQSGAISRGDYVELERGGCYGKCPVYVVRVQADGTVHWHGARDVAVKGERTTNVNPADASALIEKFQTRRFWALQGRDTQDSDDETLITTARIGDREKRIQDIESTTPDWLRDLDRQIDRLADTHRWRHGDPAIEKFEQLSQDSCYPKPGVTALMIAAGNNKLVEVQHLLKSGVDVNARDSSGWTALMYASTFRSKEVVHALLSSGADVRLRSLVGQTSIMAAAGPMSGGEETLPMLLAAGGDANVQDKDGETALMAAVHHGLYDAAKVLLQCGAAKDVQDAQGRTALDYVAEPRFASEAAYAEVLRLLRQP
jgi:hypothetical protein